MAIDEKEFRKSFPEFSKLRDRFMLSSQLALFCSFTILTACFVNTSAFKNKTCNIYLDIMV